MREVREQMGSAQRGSRSGPALRRPTAPLAARRAPRNPIHRGRHAGRNEREVEKLPDDVRDLESLHARQLSERGLETPGRVRELADGVLVQVCLECGKEYIFDERPPTGDLVCEKCGNGVFRSFFSVAGYDDVEADFIRSTERDLAPNDDESDVTRSDIIDLNNP